MNEEIRKMSIHKVYEYAEQLEQENQQLKEENTILRGHHQEMVNYAYDYMLQKDKYKLVLDEIREYINNNTKEEYENIEVDEHFGMILQILDKAGKNENRRNNKVME